MEISWGGRSRAAAVPHSRTLLDKRIEGKKEWKGFDLTKGSGMGCETYKDRMNLRSIVPQDIL